MNLAVVSKFKLWMDYIRTGATFIVKKIIRLNFTDFWPDFPNIEDSYFYKLLSRRYSIEISEDPDFLIYADFGKQYKKYNKCIRIYFTGENHRPNFKECDYAFSFDYLDNKNHYRLPLYALYLDQNPNQIVKKDLDIDKILKGKNKFCNFIYSNKHAEERVRIFKKLSKYKKVDSGGRYLNNIGGPVKDKLDFIKDYKFTIAFENCSYPGYTTEKIVHPMMVNSLPIYWGNKLVNKDFNTKSFLNYYDFKNETELIEKIIELDQNDDLYVKYLIEPYYNENKVNAFIDPENVLKQFDYIFNQTKTPVAQEKKRKWFP
jgi:alpha(1,3/1,4) fucosyltransferase